MNQNQQRTPPRRNARPAMPPPVVRRRLPFPERRGAFAFLDRNAGRAPAAEPFAPPQIPDDLLPPILGMNASEEENYFMNNMLRRPAPPNFANYDPATLNVLNVNENAVNSITFEPLDNENIMYRVSGPMNSRNVDHYVKIRGANGRGTNMRKHMMTTRKNPHTRENINFKNKTRMRRVRKAAAAVTRKRARNNGSASPVGAPNAKRPKV